jgi:hypothetical protein
MERILCLFVAAQNPKPKLQGKIANFIAQCFRGEGRFGNSGLASILLSCR